MTKDLTTITTNAVQNNDSEYVRLFSVTSTTQKISGYNRNI